MRQTDKGQLAKEKLIKTAADMFIEKGYSKTGINDILNNAGMSKGSFYFYFSSKKDLAVEVAAYFGKNLLTDWLMELAGNSWKEFVSHMIDDLVESAKKGSYYGCPIAVLGLEIAFIEPELASIYTVGMRQMISIFEKVLGKADIPKDEIYKTARKAFVIFEGHLLYYRISKDMDTFKFLKSDLLDIVK